MKYAIALCLGHDIVASAPGYISACALAEDRLDPKLAPLLYSDLAEYHAEIADGCLSWVRCTQLVAAEYGHGGGCVLSTIMAEPFNYPRYVAALAEECDWSHKYPGVVDLAVNVRGRELQTHQGIYEPWFDVPSTFDVKGRI